jgi:hypothetical protein
VLPLTDWPTGIAGKFPVRPRAIFELLRPK